jgi:hypothetical protein
VSRLLIAICLLAALHAPASADVVISARAGIGGGVGQAPRPVYGALAGIEAAVMFRGLGVGASIDRIVLERPDAHGDGDGEYQASLYFRWQHVGKGKIAWFALGAGWRRFRTAAEDPQLGDVTLHGINVVHLRSGVDWRIGKRLLVGFAFDWTIGYYRSGTYDADAAAAYTDRMDRAPPEIDARYLGGGGNIYSIGPRLSVVYD